MSKVLITRSKLDELATTIAAKSGATLPLTIAQMDVAVGGIVVGSGTDTSHDTVDAAHLLNGYTAHDSTGTQITGEYVPPTGTKSISANGTGIDVAQYASVDVAVTSCWELLASQTLTNIARTSTSAATAGTVALGSSAFTATDMIWVHVRDTAGIRAGYFYGSDSLFVNANKATGSTSTFTTPAIETIRCTTAGALAGYSGGYGVWGYSISSSGTLTIRMRYNSNYSLTINGDYKVDVYRLTPPDGIVLFPE